MAKDSENETQDDSTIEGESSGSQNTTRRLLEAAVEAFGKSGFESARVADISRSCGLTTGAVYGRWLNKREFLLAALDYVMSQRFGFMRNDDELSAADKLAKLGVSIMSGGGDDRQALVLEACVSARRDVSLTRDISRSMSSEAELLASIVADGKSSGIIDESLNTDAIVLCCQALYLGAPLAISADADGERQPGSEEWEALMERFIEAIAPMRADNSATDD